MEATAPGRERVREVVPAIAMLLAGWAAMWLMQGLPTLCALARPCPDEDVRVAPALAFGGLMLLPVAVLGMRAIGGRPRGEGVLIACYVALLGLALAGVVTVLFSGGFAVRLPWW